MSTNKQIHFLLLCQLLVIACLDMADPYWPLIVRQVGHGATATVQSTWTTLIYVAPYALTVVSAPIWAYLGKHVGYKKMIIRAVVILSLTQFMIFMSHSLGVILFLRLVQGGFAGFTAAAQAWLIDSTVQERHSYFIGKVQSVVALGSVLGPIAGGVIAHYMSYKVIFLTAGLVFIGVCGCLIFVLSETSRQPLKGFKLWEWPNYRKAPRKSLYLCALMISVQVAKWMSASFFAVYVIQNLAGNNFTVGSLYAIIAAAIILSSMAVGKWAHLSGLFAKYGLLVCLLLAALSQLLYADAHRIYLAIIASCLWGACLGITSTLPFSLLILHTSESEKATTVGLGTSANKLGCLIGIAMGGYIYASTTVELAFLTIAVAYMLIFIFVLLAGDCLKEPVQTKGFK
jgi:MFS family permease